MRKSDAGKGDAPRPMRVPRKTYEERWSSAFGRCVECGYVAHTLCPACTVPLCSMCGSGDCPRCGL